MTMPKGNGLSAQEIDSIEIAVEEGSITAIHPEKMEAFADYLVKKLYHEKEQRTEFNYSSTTSRKLVEND